jgi:hypothetical protein
MAFKLKLELLLFAILEFILLILLAVGTPLPIMQSYDNSVQFTMWEERLIQNAQTMRIPLSDLKNCDFTTEKLKAMSAFAIMSIAFCLFGLVFTILDVLHRPTHRWATEAFGVLVWCATLVVWPVGLSVFRTPMCGGSGFVPSDENWKLKEGFALMATVWALLTVSLPIMWILKLYVRPTYWSELGSAEGNAAGAIGGDGAVAENGVPVEALRRKKSKRSFIAERTHQNDSGGLDNHGHHHGRHDVVHKYVEDV